VSIQTLSALENAIEPYLNAGYLITSQTELSITLRAPARRFSWILFLLSLLIMWPVAVIYLIWFNQRRDRTICVRITSKGDIEIVGFTLRLFYRERKRQDTLTLLFITLLTILLAALVAFLKLQH
jgi:uncharacterized protein with PQ loop repeat